MYLLLTLFLAFILVVWLDTDAFIEYAEQLGMYESGGTIENFLRARHQGSPQTFIEYIQQWHDCFLIRLVTCAKCLSTWLGGLAGFLILVPAIANYGFFGGVACASAFPYLTYVAYLVTKKLK